MNQALFINSAVGAIHGYKHKEKGLPKDITYGTMGATILVSWMRSLSSMNLRGLPSAAVTQKIGTLALGVPLIMATNFCIGHHLGKALRHLDDGV
jgi:hypothetical protein